MPLLIKNAHVYSPDDLGIKDILIVNDKIATMEKTYKSACRNLKLWMPRERF